MVLLSGYRGKGVLLDPFCGSGTILIEAALWAKNRAPGLLRSFDAEQWSVADPAIWVAERQAARAKEFNRPYQIFGSDVDPDCIALAKSNAKIAGVDDVITFQTADARTLPIPDACRIVSNPPYGRRMMDPYSVAQLMADFMRHVPKSASLYLLSADEGFETTCHRRATKRRKLYNGMLRCDLYIYEEGHKP